MLEHQRSGFLRREGLGISSKVLRFRGEPTWQRNRKVKSEEGHETYGLASRNFLPQQLLLWDHPSSAFCYRPRNTTNVAVSNARICIDRASSGRRCTCLGRTIGVAKTNPSKLSG